MRNYTLNTIKGHGFAVGDQVNFYGMGADATPAQQSTPCVLTKVGTKYVLTYTATVKGDTMVWEFGPAAKIWASKREASSAEDCATTAVTDAVSDWRNGPRVIEYATTEEAYDAAMSDDTITNGAVLMVRTEGVVGVLMNAWPVAVTAANGQFHHTINPPASGTDPSWDKAVSLAVALGFPLQFAERPALMDRIRSLGAVASDVEDSAPFRTRSKVKSTSRTRRFRKGA